MDGEAECGAMLDAGQDVGRVQRCAMADTEKGAVQYTVDRVDWRLIKKLRR